MGLRRPQQLNNDVIFQQVYNDTGIPIIKRYKDHWATEEVAKTVASGRRKTPYCKGEATPPAKYAHNAANSRIKPRGEDERRHGRANRSLTVEGLNCESIPNVSFHNTRVSTDFVVPGCMRRGALGEHLATISSMVYIAVQYLLYKGTRRMSNYGKKYCFG